MTLSVVIPVYEDTEQLPDLLDQLYAMAKSESLHVETVLVDNALNESKWEVLRALKLNKPAYCITLIRLKYNIGQHYSTWLGLKYCQYKWLVTMDADLQLSPCEVPKLLAPLRQGGADLVYGTTVAGHGLARRLSSDIFWFFNHPIGTTRAETKGSCFRAMTKELFDVAQSKNYLFASIDTPLQACAKQVRTVGTLHVVRASGLTHYTFFKRLKLALLFMIKTDRTFMVWIGSSYVLTILPVLLWFTDFINLRVAGGGALVSGLLSIVLILIYKYEKRFVANLSEAIAEILV